MPSGALTSLHYKMERYWDATTAAFVGTYATAPALTSPMVFGHGAKVTGLERSNNVETIFGLGSRIAQVQLEKQFSGSISVEHVLSNPWILRNIFGSAYKLGTSLGIATTITSGLAAGSKTIVVADGTLFVTGQVAKLGTTRPEYVHIANKATNTLTLYSPTLYDHTGDTAAEAFNFTDAASPYSYIFNTFDTVPSITIQNSYDLSTDVQLLYKGCVQTGMTISCNINEPVNIKNDFIYATETLSDTAYVSQTAEDFDVFSFSHGSVYNTTPTGDITSATAMAVVQSAEITISPNAEILYGLGSRIGQVALGKQFDISVNASMYFQNTNDLLELLYTGASGSTGPGTVSNILLRLKFTNGLAGASERTIQLDFGNVKIDTDSISLDVSAPTIESITMKCSGIHGLATNATATLPV